MSICNEDAEVFGVNEGKAVKNDPSKDRGILLTFCISYLGVCVGTFYRVWSVGKFHFENGTTQYDINRELDIRRTPLHSFH